MAGLFYVQKITIQIFILQFLYVSLAQSQDKAISKTLSNCIKVTNYFFCNPDNKSTNSAAPAYEGYGYCCQYGSSAAECQENQNGNDCTLGDISVLGEPLYRTYWVGMTPSICNSKSHKLIADTTLNYHQADQMVIEQRTATTYEACHWIIGVEDYKYRDDTEAYIELRIEEMTWVNAYIY